MPNQRSGLGGQIGFATETAYGTYKAPTSFLPLESESVSLSKEYVKSAGLRAGRMSQPANQHRGTTRAAAGDTTFEFFDQGMLKFFNLLNGDVNTPAKIGTSTAYKTIFGVGLTPPIGKSATVQIGRPDVGGVYNPFSYIGGKLLSLKISIDANGICTFVPSWDFQDEKVGEALAAATYASSALPFTFQQMEALVGAESLGNVLSMEINISIPQKTDRYHLGNKGLKSEPIPNGLVAVAANASLEFGSMAEHNRYLNEEVVKISLKGTGREIDAENKMAANLVLTASKQTTSGPVLAGPDVVQTSLTFEGLDNGSEAPFSAEVISTDSAI